jgi:hypothetical protein
MPPSCTFQALPTVSLPYECHPLVFLPLNKEIHSDFSELVFLGAFVVGSGVVPVSKPPNNIEVKY